MAVVDPSSNLQPELLLTSLIAMAVSILTTVATQYFFAPTLEARKQVKLEQAAAMSSVANHLRQRLNLIYKTSSLLDVFHSQEPAGPRTIELRRMIDAQNLSHDLAAAGYSPKVMKLAGRIELVSEMYEVIERPEQETTDSLRRFYLSAIKALDPTTMPGMRWIYFRRADRHFRLTEVF